MQWVRACPRGSITAQCLLKFSKVPVFVNEFRLFRAFYRCHLSNDFYTRGITFKGKALATKCIFQNYSHLLNICTRLVLKTAEKLFVSSVVSSYRFSWFSLAQSVRSRTMNLNCLYWSSTFESDPELSVRKLHTLWGCELLELGLRQM